MQTVKVSDLSGRQLDYAVALCEDSNWARVYAAHWEIIDRKWDKNYSSNWSQGGPIIEREGISLEYQRADSKYDWTAYGPSIDCEPQDNNSPLVCAMRAYVYSRLGDSVEVPQL